MGFLKSHVKNEKKVSKICQSGSTQKNEIYRLVLTDLLKTLLKAKKTQQIKTKRKKNISTLLVLLLLQGGALHLGNDALMHNHSTLFHKVRCILVGASKAILHIAFVLCWKYVGKNIRNIRNA